VASQPARARADGCSRHDFTAIRERARQLQARDIETSDQQQAPDRGEHQQQRLLQTLPEGIAESSPRC
jgi:hypothetical protein